MPPKKRKPKRKTTTNYKYVATCQECNWHKRGKGAQGHAALHTDRTDHTTNVAISGTIIYGKLT